MQIVINIHEKDYQSILNSGQIPYGIVYAIMNGTPLDKHDEEVIAETVESIWGKPPYRDMLDKIRAEIEASKWTNRNIRIERNALASGIDKALEIIDKYKAEKNWINFAEDLIPIIDDMESER